MDPKVTAIAAVPDPKAPKVQSTSKSAQRAQAVAAKEKAAKEEPAKQAVPDQVEMRLVIEMDQASGSYVYKTINRLTGEVVSQLPRAEVLKLRNTPGYAAGDVIKTEA